MKEHLGSSPCLPCLGTFFLHFYFFFFYWGDWVASWAWVLVWWSADNLQESSKFIHTVGASGSQLLRLPFTSIYLILITYIYGCMCIKHLFVHPLTEISVVSSFWGWEQYHFEQRCTKIWLSPWFHFCQIHSQWIAGSYGSNEFLKFRSL